MRSRPYTERMTGIADRFFRARPEESHPLIAGTPEGDGQPAGLVLISSDTGLCGTYNERVALAALGFLRENPSARIVMIGRKGQRILARNGFKPVRTIGDWGGRVDFDRIQELAGWLETQFLSGEVGAWWVATTRFVNALKFQPVVERFLPLGGRPAAKAEGAGFPPLPEKLITEPDPQGVLEELLRRLTRGRFQQFVLEAFTSEHSARMLAMRGATDNASEMIETLTLVMNKARQAAITKELIEVVSGAQALQ